MMTWDQWNPLVCCEGGGKVWTLKEKMNCASTQPEGHTQQSIEAAGDECDGSTDGGGRLGGRCSKGWRG